MTDIRPCLGWPDSWNHNQAPAEWSIASWAPNISYFVTFPSLKQIFHWCLWGSKSDPNQIWWGSAIFELYRWVSISQPTWESSRTSILDWICQWPIILSSWYCPPWYRVLEPCRHVFLTFEEHQIPHQYSHKARYHIEWAQSLRPKARYRF